MYFEENRCSRTVKTYCRGCPIMEVVKHIIFMSICMISMSLVLKYKKQIVSLYLRYKFH